MRARGLIRHFRSRQLPLRSRLSSLGARIILTRPSQPHRRTRLFSTTADCTSVRHFAARSFQELPAEAKIEEELIPGYRQEDFYPVELGEVFNARYQVVAKLGCGIGSTAWLCRDLRYDGLFLLSNWACLSSSCRDNCYSTLKVCTVNRGSTVASQADTGSRSLSISTLLVLNTRESAICV